MDDDDLDELAGFLGEEEDYEEQTVVRSHRGRPRQRGGPGRAVYYQRSRARIPATQPAVDRAFTRARQDVAQIDDGLYRTEGRVRQLQSGAEATQIGLATSAFASAIGEREMEITKVTVGDTTQIGEGSVIKVKQSFSPIDLIPLGVTYLLGTRSTKRLFEKDLVLVAIAGAALFFSLERRRKKPVE